MLNVLFGSMQELRLPIMLDEAFAYLNTWADLNQKTYEVNKQHL